MTQPDFDITITPTNTPPEGLDTARAALWLTVGELFSPRSIRVLNDGVTVATALTMGRPHTAARKIVDVFADSDESFRAAVSGAIEDRGFVDTSHPAPIVIRFEEHPEIAPLSASQSAILEELGFERDASPVPSVPSTREGKETFVRGWSNWLGDRPTRRVPFYGQTTDVTCGAVTSLMMFEAAGLSRFGANGDENQHRELSFWRQATNLPACEPVGLAVAAATEITDTNLERGTPRIILSAPDLVLLEWYADNPDELRLREQLQRDSQRRAAQLGIEIERRWIEVNEIRDLIIGGADVMLLIGLDALIGDPTPHWVLAHDVIGDTLIVSDPWVESTQGESWVDTSELPISLTGIDLVTRWGDPEYRGLIVVQ
ncbi:MAG: peptidase C39 family protein [Leucobacter sp.]